LPPALQQSRLRPRIPAPGRSGTPLRPRTPVAQTRTHPRPRRLHRCPSTSRNRPRHPWQLSTRRPTVHPNGTHHENQRTTHHHRRRCRSSTINPGHRHLKPPPGAAKSRQMKLRVTFQRAFTACYRRGNSRVKGYTRFYIMNVLEVAHVGGSILWPESLYLSSATSKSYF